MLNQLQPILTQTAKHKKGRKAKSRPVFVSKRTEVLYLTALNGLVDEMHTATVDELDRLLKPQIGDSVVVADGLFDRFVAGFTNFAKSIKDKIANIAQSIAQKIVGEQKKVSDEQLAKILRKQTGVDLSGLMKDEDIAEVIKEAIGANVALINSIPQQYLDRVEMAVLNGLQRGDLNKTLSDELQKIHATTKSRAELIASDQLGKINSRLSQVRQQKLGITHYVWRTSRDERVRHSHRLRDGKLFAWDNHPIDGHAGQAIRCRCVAEPYTEHLLGGKTPEEVMAQSYSEVIDPQNAWDMLNDDSLAKLLNNNRVISKDSYQLLENFRGGLTRDDLPLATEWGFANTGLKKSLAFAEERYWSKGEEPPLSWAIHHWSINSQFISDTMRTRKNPNLKESNKQLFEKATNQSLILLQQMFKQSIGVKNPSLVYRGVGMRQTQLDEIIQNLKEKGAYQEHDESFQSNTTDFDLAMQFAMGVSKKSSDKVPVIHYAIVSKDVKMVDITIFHYYYPQNEMLLDVNQIREITAIRKRQDGVYEMFSRVTNVKEDTKNIGDTQPQKTYYVDYFEEEATRENYWGGGSVLVTLGEPGSLEKVVEDLRKMLAEELK